jgi:hypothetical protein
MNDIQFFIKNYMRATFGDFFSVIWNAAVSFCNITNFILFLMLSKGHDVNDLLRKNEFVDSNSMM